MLLRVMSSLERGGKMDADGCKQDTPLCFEEDNVTDGLSDDAQRLLEKVLDERLERLEKKHGCRADSMGFLSKDISRRINAKFMACAAINQDYEEKRKRDMENSTPEKVVGAFNSFLHDYDVFREANGLSGSINNVYEILAAMTDKLGRIARQVKHQERNDPKPDWPDGMTIEMAGLVIYMIILKNYYNVDISEGMKQELEKAIEQHAG